MIKLKRITDPFLIKVYSTQKDEESDDALDLIFEKFYNCYDDGDFYCLNNYLKELDVRLLNITTMVGILSVTLAAKSFLKNRSEFFEKTKTRLEEIAPYRVEGLLKGLQ